MMIVLPSERTTLGKPFKYLQHDHKMRRKFSSGSRSEVFPEKLGSNKSRPPEITPGKFFSFSKISCCAKNYNSIFVKTVSSFSQLSLHVE